MHNVIIIDDVVDIETQNKIEQTIFSPETQWTFGRTVFYHSHPEVTKEVQKKVSSFTKSLYRIDDKFSVEDLDLYTKPLHAAAEKINSKITSLLTSRIQLSLALKNPMSVPHIDGVRPFPFLVAIYYVNDSDGDTILYKQTTNDTSPDDVKNKLIDIDQVIPYKKGRIAVFDGSIYHSSGKPTNDVRCIINYNFV
jgi:hypothetical protein